MTVKENIEAAVKTAFESYADYWSFIEEVYDLLNEAHQTRISLNGETEWVDESIVSVDNRAEIAALDAAYPTHLSAYVLSHSARGEDSSQRLHVTRKGNVMEWQDSFIHHAARLRAALRTINSPLTPC